MFEKHYISEGIVYIADEKFMFGFVQNIPAICAQGKNEEEVKQKINKIFKVYEKRKHS